METKAKFKVVSKSEGSMSEIFYYTGKDWKSSPAKTFDNKEDAEEFASEFNGGENDLYVDVARIIVVEKDNYEVYEFMDGYFGICEKGNSGNCVHGGDSANEDDYNKAYMESIFYEWNGTLYYQNTYGYTISE